MKNLLLLATFLCTAVGVHAQLFVRPNPSTSEDSYIYVKDEVLFVEQGIDLRRNTTSNEESSIYLREESQLIQGTSNTANSGNGSISVYQNTPDSDAYDYTYWSAPVGRPHASLTGNRAFDANLISDSLDLKESNPAAFINGYNGLLNPMRISRRWIYMHERGWEEESSYQHIGNSWNFLHAGKGYTMKGVGIGNHDQVYDFRGRPHNGEITVNVYDGEWTLSGNPYPSAIDLNEMYWDSDNGEIDQFLYWDEDHSIDSHLYSANRGGYGVYVPGAYDPGGTIDNGTYTPAPFDQWNSGGGNTSGGSNGNQYKRRFAPIGQGFMIEPDGTGDGIVHIKNDYRRYVKEGNDSDFRGPVGIGSLTNPNANKLPQFRFNTYFGDSHVRQMVQLFSDDATDGFDRGFDGKSALDATSEIYIPIGDEGDALIPLVISTTNFTMDKWIPLTIKIHDEQYDVQLEIIETINFNRRVYLYDNVANTYQPIYGGNKSSTILNPGDYIGRFFITFQNMQDSATIAKEMEGAVKKDIHFFQNNPAKQLEVSNPKGYDIKEAQIFDMSGKLVYNGSNLGKESTLTFPTSHFSDGVYLVKLTTANHGTINHKMSVFNK